MPAGGAVWQLLADLGVPGGDILVSEPFALFHVRVARSATFRLKHISNATSFCHKLKSEAVYTTVSETDRKKLGGGGSTSHRTH